MNRPCRISDVVPLRERIPDKEFIMNVGTLFTKTARSFPERLAIAYGDYALTYQEANERINRMANALRKLGIEKGRNGAVLLHNCPEFLETLFACFKAGLRTVPINFRLHPKECSFIIDNSEAVAVILGDDFRDSIYAIIVPLRCDYLRYCSQVEV